MNHIRNNIKDNFAQIPNALINDNTLSDRARFIFCYMAAKSDDWKFYQDKMAKDLKMSVDTVRKYIAELLKSGWLTREEIRGERGVFDSFIYDLHPSPCRKNTESVKNGVGKNPSPLNSALTNTIPLQTKTINNKKENKVVETSSTVTLIDEVDETSVEIHHVPDYFEIEGNDEFVSSKINQNPTPQVAPTPRPKAKRETPAEDLDLVYQVVTYLNEKTEQAFQPGGEKTKSLILARHHADKWSLEDFKTVIDHKKSEWFVKDNLRQYLRPSTLFAAGHSEEYLQAAKLWKKKPVATSPGVVPLYRQSDYTNVDKSKFKF